MTSNPERLRDLLGGMGSQLGLGSPAEVGRVWAHWREIVGPSIAEHADPTSLREGVLRVRADSPAWATEIGYLGAEIQTRINDSVRSHLVDEVRVWVGPRPEPKEMPRAPGEGSSTPVKAAGSSDPEAALERAKRAWARRVGNPSASTSREAPGKQEKRR